MEFDTDDVASSQGVFGSEFNDILLGIAQMFSADDDCDIAGGGDGDPTGFHVGGINVRRVEPRNAPTVINAALNFRNFWDGRANNIFNGVNPFGRRDPDAAILEVQPGDSIAPIMVEFENSSLASQAVGAPLSPFEMSCAGRAFAKLGKKMLNLTPLGLQHVHADDSVLGPLAVTAGADPRGLQTTYEEMIRAAFDSRFWDSDELFDVAATPLGMSGIPIDTSQFTMTEINFPFFWGIAVQMYENQLISDDSPFDNGTLSEAAARGLDVFTGDGKCINCHATAMFTKASTLHLVDEAEEEGLVERMVMGDERFHYSIRGLGIVTRRRPDPGYHAIFDAEGTPGVDGDGIVSPAWRPTPPAARLHC